MTGTILSSSRKATQGEEESRQLFLPKKWRHSPSPRVILLLTEAQVSMTCEQQQVPGTTALLDGFFLVGVTTPYFTSALRMGLLNLMVCQWRCVSGP